MSTAIVSTPQGFAVYANGLHLVTLSFGRSREAWELARAVDEILECVGGGGQ